MKRSILRGLAASVAALGLLAPATGQADTPYTIHWAFTDENAVCETAELGAHDGAPFFQVNGTPLPTYELPGAFVTNPDSSESNVAEAGFSSTLLRTGSNDVFFSAYNASGDDTCVHQHNIVTLVAPSLGINKPLFNVRRDGTAFQGNAQVSLSLQEINPPLSRDIANLEAKIALERKEIIEDASKTADLISRLDALQKLDTELRDLVNRPLDMITTDDLNSILDHYQDLVDEATKEALDKLILDLQKSVMDLQDELQSLVDNFGMQADAAAHAVTKDAEDAGFVPDDPAAYAMGPASVPWVDVPDISNVPGAFTPGNDPYDAYADKVIAELSGCVFSGMVVNRPDFVAHVRAWRANEAALQKAISLRPNVSLAETNAFLNGQNKVTGYVHKFMDPSDWFLDSPVPANVRADVDGVLKHDFSADADQMKDNMNLWPGPSLDAAGKQVCDTIDAFANAISVIGNGFAAYGDLMKSLVHGTERLAIGFVPYVGPALDLCEAVTGKEWCLPGGNDLSTEQRVFSAAGVAISGVAKFWSGAKLAAISPAAKIVAEDMTLLEEELAIALRSSRRTWYKTLRGAVSPIKDEFERKAALHLMQHEERAMIGVGDDGVRKVLGIPMRSPIPDVSKAPDFLTVTKGNGLALSEAKTDKIGEAVAQLMNGVKKLQEIGLAGDLERVEIIVKKGAGLGDNNYKILNGYLVKATGNAPVAIEGVPGITNLFVRIIEI